MQNALSSGLWTIVQGDHCANADPILDGRVTGPKLHRTGALFSKKPSVYCCRNIEEHLELKQCAKHGCRMKVPGESYHVLQVSNQTGVNRPGQRRMDEHRKAIVPLGVHDALFSSHLRCINESYAARTNRCSKCRGTGQLLHCSNLQCKRAQHEHCSRLASDNIPWLCDSCALLQNRS